MEKSAIKSFSFKNFSQLDDCPDADYFIESMKRSVTHPDIIRIKKKAVEMLGLTEDATPIDLGCGTGFDAELMAAKTKQRVVAVDNSEKMISLAARQSQFKHVSYQVADVNQLFYLNDSFSHTRMDRLLVSQKDRYATFDEALRITKQGGKLCITDVDFGSIVLYPFNKEIQRVINRWQLIVENPYIGRELYALFVSHGLKNIKLDCDVYINQDYKDLLSIINVDQIIDDLVTLEEFTQSQADNAKLLFHEASARGKFLYSINFYTVVGQK